MTRPSKSAFRPRLHEQIKPPLIAKILDPYEVTPDKFAQVTVVLFAHVNAALGLVHMSKFSQSYFIRIENLIK